MTLNTLSIEEILSFIPSYVNTFRFQEILVCLKYIDIFRFVLYDLYIEKNECEVLYVNTAYENNAKVFKAFCDTNRLMILEMLQSGEMCACKILERLNISQSTLSHHMKILCDSGIVSSRKEGKWTHYSMNSQGCDYAKKLLESLTALNIKAEDFLCENIQ